MKDCIFNMIVWIIAYYLIHVHIIMKRQLQKWKILRMCRYFTISLLMWVLLLFNTYFNFYNLSCKIYSTTYVHSIGLFKLYGASSTFFILILWSWLLNYFWFQLFHFKILDILVLCTLCFLLKTFLSITTFLFLAFPLNQCERLNSLSTRGCEWRVWVTWAKELVSLGLGEPRASFLCPSLGSAASQSSSSHLPVEERNNKSNAFFLTAPCLH